MPTYRHELNDALDYAMSEVQGSGADCPNCENILEVVRADEDGMCGSVRCSGCGKDFYIQLSTSSDGVVTAQVTGKRKK